MNYLKWLACHDCFLFHHLSPEQRMGLLQQSEKDLPIETFPKGASIYSCHDFQRALGIVLCGAVQVSRTGGDGRRVVMNTLLPGQIFGAAALFGECEAYVTEVDALRAARVMFVSQKVILEWMQQDYRIGENYIRFLSDRVRFLNQKIAAFTDGQADDRLKRYLLGHCSEEGEVILPRSMVELAQSLNIGRSSLYRSLDALSEKGLIRREGKHIYVVSIERLEAACTDISG